MSNNVETDRVSNFLIRIAENVTYRKQYEENPTKIMNEADIPKQTQVAILSGDSENVQNAVGITSVCYMLVHTDIVT